MKQKKISNEKKMKHVTIVLAIMTFIVWLLLYALKHFIPNIESNTIFNDILSNTIGTLPPIIIFGFIYEYCTKKYVANEISERIMETLTGNAKMMETFEKKTRINFIYNTIQSIVGEKSSDMVCNVIKPYISYDKEFDFRKDFEYLIELHRLEKKSDIGSEIFLDEKYYAIKEHISYTKSFAKSDDYNGKLSIGFFWDSVNLERELLNKKYIFRENLIILDEDIRRLRELSAIERKNFIKNFMKLQLKIDDLEASIDEVKIGKKGISINFIAKNKGSKTNKKVKDSFEIKIGFTMPQLKTKNEFLVSIAEPTYNPKIIFTYIPDIFRITVYQFFNEDSELIKNASAFHGRIEIVHKGWIYPVKGVLFIIEANEEYNI